MLLPPSPDSAGFGDVRTLVGLWLGQSERLLCTSYHHSACLGLGAQALFGHIPLQHRMNRLRLSPQPTGRET